MKYRDLELEAGTYRVERSAANVNGRVVIKATKSKKSRRAGFLPDFLIKVLLLHREQQQARHMALGLGDLTDDDFVFDRFDGRPWDPNEMSRKFSRMVRGKKLPPFRLHDLRIGYGTHSFAAGGTLKVVSETMGHSGVGITSSTYVHILDESKRGIAKLLDAHVRSAIPALAAPTPDS